MRYALDVCPVRFRAVSREQNRKAAGFAPGGLFSFQYHSKLLHVGQALPGSPPMYELAAGGRRDKLSKRLHLDAARPVSGLDLDKQHVSAADADNVPRAQGSRAARASVSGGFEHVHRAVFVSGSLRFAVHDDPRFALSWSSKIEIASMWDFPSASHTSVGSSFPGRTVASRSAFND